MSKIKTKLLKGFTLTCTELKQVFKLYNQKLLSREQYYAIIKKHQENHRKGHRTNLIETARNIFDK
jgi:hypothetical protein